MRIETIGEQVDNGRSKIRLYDVDGKIIEHKYNYGKGWGFLFLTEFYSIDAYNNRLFRTGAGKQIYSSIDPNSCTAKGRQIEFAIMKFKM